MQKNKVLGTNLTTGAYIDFIHESVQQKSGYSCFLNSHMLYEFYTKLEFQNVLNNAKYLLPDGMPVTYSVKLFVNNKQERIAGNDVIFSLIDYAKQNDLKIFLIGTTEEILSKISEKLNIEEVNHKTYSPPYLPIEKFDIATQEQIIIDYNPDLIFVGLGCPKQEIWMYKMHKRLNIPMYGLGGAFLLYAGIDRRAPPLIRRLALEWVYRLALEPKRLFKRYFVTNLYFCYLFCKEIYKRLIR